MAPGRYSNLDVTSVSFGIMAKWLVKKHSGPWPLPDGGLAGYHLPAPPMQNCFVRSSPLKGTLPAIHVQTDESGQVRLLIRNGWRNRELTRISLGLAAAFPRSGRSTGAAQHHSNL